MSAPNNEINYGIWRRANCDIGADISEELAVGTTMMLEAPTDTFMPGYTALYSWRLETS
jgi:hypothetical protein